MYMKHFFTLSSAILCAALSLNSSSLFAQAAMEKAAKNPSGPLSHAPVVYNGLPAGDHVQSDNSARRAAPKNGPQNNPGNYRSFSATATNTSAEAIAANAGYEHHPEAGLLYENAPCSDCYEMIGLRTETTKTFYKEGKSGSDGGRDIMVQTSTAPLHYKDAAGNWLTFKTLLEPDNSHKGVYAAAAQEVPVTISTNEGNTFSSLGKKGNSFEFNHNLELVFARPDGSEVSLGAASWASYTAGDDGVYVTNAWPGIDIEMHTSRGAVKTNFYINHAMPEYAAGKLLLRDHLQMDKGLSLFADGKTKVADNIEIRNAEGFTEYHISAPIVCEKKNLGGTLRAIEYYINGNVLDIAVPGNYLNRAESAYPVIIDPLVTGPTASTPVGGSTYSAAYAAHSGCVYSITPTVPANVTITDIRFGFIYVTSGGAWLNNGATDFYYGTPTGCRSPAPPTGIGGLYWFCNAVGAGSCTADGTLPYTVYDDFKTCLSPPQCASYTFNMLMYFYEDYGTKPACSVTYVTSGSPLTVTVYGHTVEINPATATPATICAGQSSTLAVTPTVLGSTTYTTGPFTTGVPPYTYSWSPGGLTGSSVVVSPATTTTYTVTITDACGITATTTKTITVNTAPPITGASICTGQTTTIAIPAGTLAHTWGSSATGVATVTAGGVVTGVSAGTAIITLTITATGCYSTAVVTVTPLPAVITGTTTLCVGGTTTLSDATAGGAWSSSNTAIATVSATGVVSGVATGGATITYGNPTCYVTIPVTVNLIAPITGTLTVCQGATTTLADAAGAGTWASGTTTVATISATGVVTGVSGGTSIITFTAASGCATTAVVTVNPIAPITGTLSLCLGSTTTLGNTVAAGTWSSGTTTVATIGATTGAVTTAGNGTTTIVYTTPAGCTTSAVLTVNPLAAITGVLTVCAGSTTTLSDIAAGGTWSSGSTGIATVVAGTGVVTGVSGGNSTIVYTTGAGCSVSAVVTVYPLTPITGTTTLCVGSTSTLSDPTGGGTWSSSNTAVATIGAGTGVVSGLSVGTSNIIYTTGSGCSTNTVVSVITVAPITGIMTVCVGNTTTLADATAGGTWNTGTPTVAAISAGGVVSGLSAGTTSVVYTASGCVSTATVTVEPLPAAITGTTSVCVGLTTSLSDATTGGAWSSSATGVASIDAAGVVTGVSAGPATITYKLPTGCYITVPVVVNPLPAPVTGPFNVCLNATVTMTDPNPGGTWLSGNTAVATINPASGSVLGVAVGAAPVTYTLATGCTITSAITVLPLPAAPVTAPLDYCRGDNPVPALTATGNNLLWFTPGTGATGSSGPVYPSTSIAGVFVYSVTQTVNNCQSAFGLLSVHVHVKVAKPLLSSARPYACQNDTLTYFYSGNPSSFAGETFAWSLPGDATLKGGGLSSSSVVLSFDTSIGTNLVYLTVGDGYIPCNVTDSLPMIVYLNAPLATFYMKPDVCVGDSVVVALTSIGTGVTDFTWDFDGASVVKANSNHGGPYKIVWHAPGIYTVAVTAISNQTCPSTPVRDTVNVHPYPDAQIGPVGLLNNKTTLCLSDSVLLQPLNYDAQNQYSWAPAHFFAITDQRAVYGRIEKQGFVTLTVTSPFGWALSESIFFNPGTCCAVSFPNAFTPGQLTNKVFRPISPAIHAVHDFTIVNRWGQIVFKSTDVKGAWDGTFNGVPQDMDVYYYYFKYDCEGKTLEEKGEVNLVR